MTIIRVLVLFLLFWLIFRIIKIKMAKRKIIIKKTPKIVDIKPCNHCGVHISVKDAIKSDNKYYCCSKHLELDTRNN